MALHKMDSLNSMSDHIGLHCGRKSGAWSSSGHRACEKQGDKAHGGCMPECHSSAQAIESVHRVVGSAFLFPGHAPRVQPNMVEKV